LAALVGFKGHVQQCAHGGLSRADRIFNHEHDIVGQRAKLSDEGQIPAAMGTTCGLSPFSRGRNWLVMKGNMQGMWRGPQDFRSFGLYLQLTQDFGHQLTTGTG
jgi:hypothetical protein